MQLAAAVDQDMLKAIESVKVIDQKEKAGEDVVNPTWLAKRAKRYMDDAQAAAKRLLKA